MSPSLPHQQKTILGHPIGLYILFFTELWERFSFYGMKALLIFYLVKYHLFSDSAGNLLVGSYAAMVYAMPVLGGYIADKYLGFRKAVIFGGVMLVLGHLGMAYEGNAATESLTGEIVRDDAALQVFYLSLSFIILGVGFLKANVSSLVGELYEEGDIRRDSGFTIFYMGINLGSFVSTLLCTWLGEAYGWSYGFGAAGIGMVLGLATFIWGKKHLEGKGEPKDPEAIQKKNAIGISKEWSIYLISILSTGIIWFLVQEHDFVQILLISGAVASFAFIVYMLIQLDKVARERLIALTILIIFSVVFWSLFEQAYMSLNLFADRVLDREIFGIEIKAGQFLSLNALFIILFAPLFSWLWVKLGKLNPNTAVKFSLAIILVALGFGALVLGINVSELGKVGMWWLVLAYLLHTWGELCLSPVGLSAVTKLSPPKIVGFMMGVWFLATAGSEFIASILSNLASIETAPGAEMDLALAKESYLSLYEYLFYSGLGFGLLLLIISPVVKKLMHGVDKEIAQVK